MFRYLATVAIVFSISSFYAQSQKWSLLIKSNVELRTWKLTTKADREDKALSGANIKLYNGATLISEGSSQANGDFSVLVPPNGEFVMTVSYPGCNPKKFSISTTGVPDDMSTDSYKPTFSIGGFIMAKPLPGIEYSGLQQSLLRVEFKKRDKKFDNDEAETERGKRTVSKIFEAEDMLVEKFCSLNREGDAALIKPDCPLAKACYEKAIALIPGEQYPVVQLPKVGKCLKDAEEAAKKAEELAKAEKEKAEAQAKADKEKAEAQAKADKEKADKKVIEEALAKAAADKAAKEQAEAEKLMKANADAAKQKEAEEKKAAQEKKLADEKKAAEDKEKRIAEEKKAVEEKKLAEEKRIADEKKAADEKRMSEEQKLAEEKKAAQEKKLADEKKAAEDKEKRIAEEKKAVEEKKLAEEKRIADEKKAEDEKKMSEEQKLAEEKKAAQEKKLADEKKAAEDKEKRIAEEKKAVEDKLAEEKRIADEKKAADKKAVEEQKIANEKKAEENKPKETVKADNTKVVVETPPVVPSTPAVPYVEPKVKGPIIIKEKNAKQAEYEKRRQGQAKANAEEQAAYDAKHEKEWAEQEEREKEEKKKYEAAQAEAREKGEFGDAYYQVPQPMDADKYRPTMQKAEDHMKRKRYAEAKKAYEEALKYKPNDVVATNKLAEVNKILAK